MRCVCLYLHMHTHMCICTHAYIYTFYMQHTHTHTLSPLECLCTLFYACWFRTLSSFFQQAFIEHLLGVGHCCSCQTQQGTKKTRITVLTDSSWEWLGSGAGLQEAGVRRSIG